MRYLDMDGWSRREHFNLYSAFEHPQFGLTANVDLSDFYPFLKQHGISFTVAMVYLLSRASNSLAEFRYRIRSGCVVEHEIVHPSFTILVEEYVFSFCTVDYDEDFSRFNSMAEAGIERVRANLEMEDEPGRDDLLFMTSIPWISFTSFSHPRAAHPADSIPRFAWGKLFQDGDTLKMPVNVEVHHALIDGAHVGKFYQELQGYLSQPEIILGNA